LKELGELLDAGDSGLLVVAATDLESRVEKALERADKLTKKQLAADVDQLSEEIEAAAS
jgi:hypothetical protein